MESKQGGTLKFVNPKHENWVSVQLLNLSFLTYLFTLQRCQVIFQWKQTKEKLGNPLSAWSFRVDLTWRMVFLLGVFARIVKVTDFTQVINFHERTQWKIHPRKVDKNNKESMNLLLIFVLFFNTTGKKGLLPLLQHNTKTKKFFVLSFL